ncbi:unnamed protein product [Caenorhabditis bovis]|uniref:Uncharacterized protein n=1 Tax=Caenorhabditis bovis TaxID=2654633 RepID=A0A8S1EU02_9PELO|nr:unnamed protein product [Caenorhabditis bovis]
MFWSQPEDENSLVKLLNTSNFTLEEVLLNEYVVQESRYCRESLINFITKKENIIKLVQLSLCPDVDPNLPVKQQYRLSFIASEILTVRGSDVYQHVIVTCDETKKVLVDFLNSKEPLNHLVAGFFAKIMECLLSKQFDATYAIIRDTPFFDKCIQNIHLGAIECLLENLLRIPSSIDNMNVLKQWMIDDNLFDKILDRINENTSDDDNECLSEVYSEIVKEIRDKLYVLENKDDPLHDLMMSEDLIRKIVDKIAIDIMDTMIRTNFVLNAPSHLIDEEMRQELDDRHSGSISTRHLENNVENFEVVYQPDPDRIAETILAERILPVFQVAKRCIELKSPAWQQLMELLVAICNTNHTPTHEKLLSAFIKLPIVGFVEIAKKNPKMSVLHALVEKMFVYILYSKVDKKTLSPIAEYLLKDASFIEAIYGTMFFSKPMPSLIEQCGLRAFNMNLAQAVYKSSMCAPMASAIQALVQKKTLWEEISDSIKEYNSHHRPFNPPHDNNESNLTSNPGFDSDDRDFLNDSEEWKDASQFLALNPPQKPFGASSTSDADKFNFSLDRFPNEIDSGPFDDTPDEDEFRKLCSQRANSSSCSLNNSNISQDSNNSCSGWPGLPTENNKGVANAFEKTGEFLWPNKLKEDVGRSSNSNDSWADFSTLPASSTGATVVNVQWPGADQPEKGESSDWPLSNSHDFKPSDPLTVGFVSGISHNLEDTSDA